MRIKRMDVFARRFKLRYLSAVAYGTQDVAPNIFVRLETDSGIVGWGSGAPDEEVTGETPESVQSFLEDVAPSIFMGANPLERVRLMACLRKASAGKNPTACAALSIALYDLLGKITGFPVYDLLGGTAQPLLTSYTISLCPIDYAKKQVRRAVESGFRILKLKLGKGPEEDAERVRELRNAAGPAVRFRLDANQGYSLEDTLGFINRIDPSGIEFLEQPTPKTDLATLKKVARSSPIPIMADEAVLDAADALRIVSQKTVPLVNIKLMKCGGLDEAMQIDTICAAGGVYTMLGCMDESALSITAALHLAMALPNVSYIDLDGHFDIIDDIAVGSPIFADGCLQPASNVGFGVEIQEEH